MAVFCGVCANRIFNAIENYGEFAVNDSFQGWDVVGTPSRQVSRITDTCDICGPVLQKVMTAAVSAAAQELAIKHATQIAERRAEVEFHIKQEKMCLEEKAAFEIAWRNSRK